ncbi:MAG: phosphodiester glycosidase family protein [Chloroflexota bacterium]
MTHPRVRATLLAAAFVASVGWSSPVLADPAAMAPDVPLGPASTTIPFAATSTDPVAAGVQRRHGRWTTSAGPQVVEVIDVDPAAPGISLEVSGPAAGPNALETVRSQAARASRDGHRVIAAINGDTFGAVDATTRAPAGLQVHRGEVITGSTTTKPTLGFDADESARLGDVSLRASMVLADGITKLAIDRLNKPRQSGDLVLYTRRWGASTHTSGGGSEVVLTGAALPLRVSGTWTATVASVKPTGHDTVIPTGSLVLSALGTDAAKLATLTVGSTVTIATSITAGWEGTVEAIGGREWLVEGGHESVRPVSTLTTETHPRTAIGLRADGTLALATVDGRQAGYSVGVTASELADLFVDEGAVKAIMLDGGGSTTTFVRRPGDVEATLVNRPSDGFERPVDDALFVISSTPTGPLADIVVRPGVSRVVVGEIIPFQARGVDAAMNGVSIAGLPVTWSKTGGTGTLSGSGSFRATDTGDATITAAVGSRSGGATVAVIPDTIAPLASSPVTRIRRGATVDAGSVPVTISWPAAVEIGTGVQRYELRRKLDGGGWADVALPSPMSLSVSQGLPPGRAVQYEVRAIDRAGNASAWRTGSGFHLRLASERASSMSYSGRWTTSTSSAYLGGATKSSRVRGAAATYSFSGNQVAWIAPRGPTRGSARVSVDGKAVATVSLYSATRSSRRAVFTYAFATTGRHRITIRVLGTAGHPRVAIDGFAVVDSASTYPVLVGAGDISSCANSGDAKTTRVLERIPGTVFTAGDNAYDSGSAAQYANCYHPMWGRFKGRTRPVPGNHEYETARAVPYFAYFGARAGTPGQGWYAYDVGTWRVYSLNSNCSAVGGCGAGSPQEAWLRADLAANPRTCVAAIWHHPLFSSGEHGNNAATRGLWNALYEGGADIVINGHDHDYERFAPQRPDGTGDAAKGIREFVVGTGGVGLRRFSTTRANSQVRKSTVLGVLRLELKSASYAWRFMPVAGSTWTDTGSTACH